MDATGAFELHPSSCIVDEPRWSGGGGQGPGSCVPGPRWRLGGWAAGRLGGWAAAEGPSTVNRVGALKLSAATREKVALWY